MSRDKLASKVSNKRTSIVLLAPRRTTSEAREFKSEDFYNDVFRKRVNRTYRESVEKNAKALVQEEIRKFRIKKGRIQSQNNYFKNETQNSLSISNLKV